MIKRKALFYIVAVVIFSLQSCVSHYIVSVPAVYRTKSSEEVLQQTEDLSELNEDINIFTYPNDKSLVVKELDISKVISTKKEIKNTIIVNNILSEANTYLGTKYRFGGATRSGIDCSAFVLSVFDTAAGVSLPRVVVEQAREGEKIDKEDVRKGDLLFFQTRGKRVSHVGIVKDVTNEGEIKFIHASSSRGVIISSLNEKYWATRYRFATRIL